MSIYRGLIMRDIRKVILACLLVLFYFENRRYPELKIETQYLIPYIAQTL